MNLANEKIYDVGLDIGSTTLKLTVLDSKRDVIFKQYRRHHAEISSTLQTVLQEVIDLLGKDAPIRLMVTGSAGMGLAEKHHLPFGQEVIAATHYVAAFTPNIRTLVDIGGEDAKMVFFHKDKAPDIRMNDSCAGGPGAFLDQVAVLLDCPVEQLDMMAANAEQVHSIASRCGVFAKTDIQTLLGKKVPKTDIVASVFQAVANQVVTALSRGHEIVGPVLFCGGPLAFIPRLRLACLKAMNMDLKNLELPEFAAYIPSLGAAVMAQEKGHPTTLREMQHFLAAERGDEALGARLPALFQNEEEFQKWWQEKQRFALKRVALREMPGDECFLGIDSGSTTAKVVAVDQEGHLVFTYYANNRGDALEAVAHGLQKLREEIVASGRPEIKIRAAAVTGYGEDLIKAAWGLNYGLVETIAHYQAARHFDPQVDFVLDIGGQDMKAIFIHQGAITKIDLNEACSSGCGSFIEGLAKSLQKTPAEFAQLALKAEHPCDLGTRCTVFMNSRVKQALREGAAMEDIAAGLAYAVVKNCLYKVLKLKDARDLGQHLVVQGGTMRNLAVVRAFEKLSGGTVAFTDVPELMGAFGAALYAQEHGAPEVLMESAALAEVPTFATKKFTCHGCANACQISRYDFSGRLFFAGNRCEKIFSNLGTQHRHGKNLFPIKYDLLFNRAVKTVEGKKEFHPWVIGIPRGLNYYEDFPFWDSLLTNCGMIVKLSGRSTNELYESGLRTIAADNICFPAKIMHGHIYDLIHQGVERILMPFVVFEYTEDEQAANKYNCPVVAGYSDVIRSMIDPEAKHQVKLDVPGINFADEKLLAESCWEYVQSLGVSYPVFRAAFKLALKAQKKFRKEISTRAQEIAQEAIKDQRPLIVLVGRPYHTDPLIQHQASEMIAAFGVDVVSEDVVRTLKVKSTVKQWWSYPGRILRAAEWVATMPDNVQLVQLTSFGCGPDAFLTDAAAKIMQDAGRPYTLLKIDDVSNLGPLRLRVRSLLESLAQRKQAQGVRDQLLGKAHLPRPEKKILIPFMSEFFSPVIEALMKMDGHVVETLPPPDAQTVDYGLRYANNDVCYPAILVVGDIVKAALSGRYDPQDICFAFSQTNGQCRASSYIHLIKKALAAAGLENIPLFSLKLEGEEDPQWPRLKVNWKKLMLPALRGFAYADKIMQLYYAAAPREKIKGTVNRLRDRYMAQGAQLIAAYRTRELLPLLQQAAVEFEAAIKHVDLMRVGIVGEIYLKYSPFANRHIADWLVQQNVWPIFAPICGFFLQFFPNRRAFIQQHVIKKTFWDWIAPLVHIFVNRVLRKFDLAVKDFTYHQDFDDIYEQAEKARPLINLAAQYGEGWIIAAELAAMAEKGVQHAVSIQPFGCIANHLIAKGISKRLREFYPKLNFLSLDFDNGTSDANMINRLQFLLQTAAVGRHPQGAPDLTSAINHSSLSPEEKEKNYPLS
ncbi:MAG: 2-hydroxyacyl-CoA dehydratase [Bacteriovoracaceae bacterium]|nr:2-hydroxyacyl-CoA dehydratase [Bacteriovoracaceae bacterium]